MKRLPPLKALHAFRYAAEAQSFKVAAQQLNVTQAAISQQIKTLEEQLDVKLFQRLTREVVLTPEGMKLLPYVSKAFMTLEEGVMDLAQDPNPNRLTLSALPSFAGRWLVPRLGLYQQQMPDVALNLQPCIDLINFERGEPDLAIRFGRGDYPGLTVKPLLKEYLLPVCHPSLLDMGQPISPQLAELPLLADDCPDIDEAWSEFQRVIGMPFRHESTQLHVTDAAMLVEALLCGQGFGILRFSLAYDLLERGQLVCPFPVYLSSAFDYYLVAPEAHFQRPKVKRFESWLGEEIKVIEQSWERFCLTSSAIPDGT